MAAYVLSIDPRLDLDGIYRVERRASGNLNLVNELGANCTSPGPCNIAPNTFAILPLSEAQYHRLFACYVRGTDADLEEAQRLITSVKASENRLPQAHLQHTWSGADLIAAACATPPWGPGFSRDIAATATRLEAWGSRFHPAHDDVTEFRLWW